MVLAARELREKEGRRLIAPALRRQLQLALQLAGVSELFGFVQSGPSPDLASGTLSMANGPVSNPPRVERALSKNLHVPWGIRVFNLAALSRVLERQNTFVWILPLYDARTITFDSTQSYGADSTASLTKTEDPVRPVALANRYPHD